MSVPCATSERPVHSAWSPGPSRPRIGFVGLGWIGANRLAALAKSGRAEVVALADERPAATLAASQLVPDTALLRSIEELIDLHPDGIVIATPNALHADQVMTALKAGCAVFCQKPLGRTAAETRRILDAAREADRLLGIDLSYRHTLGMSAIHRLIRDGGIGWVSAVEMKFHNGYGPDKAWFYDRTLSGGGCLLDLATHLIDLALWCLDFPIIGNVSGRLLSAGCPLAKSASGPVEDYAAAQVYFQNGVLLDLSCSWKAAVGSDARIEATFLGENGGASFHNVNGSFYDFVAEQFMPDRTRHILTGPPDDWGGRAIVGWVEQLTTHPEFNPEVESAYAVASALDAIYRHAQ